MVSTLNFILYMRRKIFFFFDVVGIDGERFNTYLFFEPTGCHQYIVSGSYNLVHIKQSVVYSHDLRNKNPYS